MFGLGKKIFGAAAREVKADYSGNRDYLEAVCAAAALVSVADGELEDSEKTKTINTLASHPVLGKMYDRNAIEKCAEDMFRRSRDRSGRQSLAGELDDIKSRPDGQKMADDIYLVASDVAMADGQLEPEEAVVLEKIAKRLNVDPSKFDF